MPEVGAAIGLAWGDRGGKLGTDDPAQDRGFGQTETGEQAMIPSNRSGRRCAATIA
jgi:hypothetical protein